MACGRHALWLVAALCLLGGASAVTVGTASMSQSFSLIVSAVNAASDGDTLTLADGTFTGCTSTAVISKNLAIIGGGLPVIDCQLSGPAFFVLTGTLTLSGMTIKNAQRTTLLELAGGAIVVYTSNAKLVAVLVTFIGNSAPNGGAIGVHAGATLNVTSCTFTNNQASQYGGGIMVNGSVTPCTLYMTGTTMTLNTAKCGGGVLGWSPKATISGTTFAYNSAQYGGALANFGDTTNNYATDCTFHHNNASIRGGALRFVGGSYNVNYYCTRCTFVYNSAGDGGAFFLQLVTFYLSSATVSHNRGRNSGGVVNSYNAGTIVGDTSLFFNNSAPTGGVIGCYPANYGIIHYFFTTTTFMNNTATISGGVADLGHCGLSLTGVNWFTNNVANAGGVISVQSGSVDGFLSLDKAVFADNTARTGDGGAIWSTSTATTLSLSTGANFTRNYSPTNGGAISQAYGVISLNGVTFDSNSASTGGAIYTLGTTFTLRNSNLVNNVATGPAGGVMLINTSPTTISSTIFTRNTAVVDGSALYLNLAVFSGTSLTFRANVASSGTFYSTGYSAATLTGTTFQDNMATQGGGIYLSTGTMSMTTANFTTNTASDVGGGILSRGALSITGGTFTGNSATNFGGGIEMGNTASLTASNVNLISNIASSGAGLYASDVSTVSWTTGTFKLNSASGLGGAVAATTSVSLTMSLLTITANSALSGGGISMGVSASLAMSSSTLKDNTASSIGGALFLASGSATITASTISGNTAGVRGGGVAVGTGALAATGSLSFVTSQVVLNTAPLGGGVALWSNVAFSLSLSNVSANAAATGAAISCATCALTSSSSVIMRNAGSRGAALFCDPLAPSSPVTMDTSTIIMENVASDEGLYQANCTACGCCPVPIPMHLGESCAIFRDRLCNFTCDAGYTKATDLFTCPHNAVFNQFDSCIPIPCPELTAPDGGNVTSSVGAITKSTVTYSCNTAAGFRLVHDAVRECLGPNWLGPTPYCSTLPCPQLSAITHGTLNVTGSYGGDHADYSCHAGYDLIGNASRDCIYPVWQGEAPRCDPIVCPPPAAPINGTVVPTSSGQTGDLIQYFCNEGYLLVGATGAECVGPTWAAELPICDALLCDPLPVLENGAIVLTGNRTGAHAVYTCDPGYYLDGDSVLECIAPSWRSAQNKIPTCNPIFCNDFIATMLSSCTAPYAYGSQCQIGCKGGYSGPVGLYTCVQPETNAPGQWRTGITSYEDVVLPCNLCPANQYMEPLAGLDQCRACPNGTTDGPGKDAISACVCNAGFYEDNEIAGVCITCPLGGFCTGGKDAPVAAAGYFESNGAFIACYPTEACLGVNNCEDGYRGYLCGACTEGHYKLNGYCKACPGDTLIKIIAAAIGGTIAACLLIITAKPGTISERSFGFVSTTIGLAFVQFCAAFDSLELPWPTITRTTYATFSAANLNIELLQPECIYNLSFYQKTNIVLLIPLFLLAIFIILYILMLVFSRVRYGRKGLRKRTIELAESLVAGFLHFMVLAYLLLAKASLDAFSCKTQLDGRVTLTRSPDDVCYDDEWKANIKLPIFGFVVYVVGIPILLIIFYLRFSKQQDAFTSRLFYFYVGKYSSHHWYWEIVVMARKLVIIIFAAFLGQQPILQAVCVCIILFVFCIVTILIRPYRWAGHDFLDVVCLGGLLVVVFAGVMMTAPTFRARNLADVAIVVVISVVILIGVLVFLTEMVAMVHARRARAKLMGKPKLERKAHASHVTAVAATPQQHVYSGDEEGKLRVWRFQRDGTFAPVAILAGHPGHRITALAPMKNSGMLSAGMDGTVRYWDTEMVEYSPQAMVEPAMGSSFAVDMGAPLTAMTLHRGTLFIGDIGGRLRIKDLEEFLVGVSLKQDLAVEHLLSHSGSGSNGSDAGSGIASEQEESEMSEDGLLKKDDKGKGSASTGSISTLLSSRGSSRSSRGSGSAGSGSRSKKVTVSIRMNGTSSSEVIDPKEGIKVHTGGIAGIVVTQRYIYTAGTDDMLVRKLNRKTLKAISTWLLPGARILSLAARGTQIYVGRKDAEVHVIDQLTGHTDIAGGHMAGISAVMVSGKFFMSASHDGRMIMWDRKTLEYQQTLGAMKGSIDSMCQIKDHMIGGCASGDLVAVPIVPAWNVKAVRFNACKTFCPALYELYIRDYVREVERDETRDSGDNEDDLEVQIAQALSAVAGNMHGTELRQVVARVTNVADAARAEEEARVLIQEKSMEEDASSGDASSDD